MRNIVSVVKGLEDLQHGGLDTIVYRFIVKRHKHFGVSHVTTDKSQLPRSSPVLTVRAQNPLTDFECVEEALLFGSSGVTTVTLTGAIPGSEFETLEFPAPGQNNITRTYSAQTQLRYNNQFNLRKHKRQKMFKILCDLEPELWKFDIPQVGTAVKRHHRALCLYGVYEDAVDQLDCPACGSQDFTLLHGDVSQPVIGYVSPEIALYRHCSLCGLGYMSPHVSPKRTGELYDDYDFLDSAQDLSDLATKPVPKKLSASLDLTKPFLSQNVRALDLGGGTGRFSLYAKKLHPEWTVVHSDFETRRQSDYLSSRGIETRTLNIIADPLGHAEFDLITAFEVIEHLDFKGFSSLLDKVTDALRPGGIFLLTTPDLDSPLVRAFDFFNAYAPHHLLLFSKSWLNNYFEEHADLEIVAQSSGGDLLEDNALYFDYYATTSRNLQACACARVLKTFLEEESNRDAIVAKGFGSEVIVVLRKR